MSAFGRPPRLVVPRWVQLVGLPMLLLLLWWFVSAAAHVVFLFLVAALVALLLDPVVRALQKVVRFPRGLAVAFVYLVFAAALALVIFGIATAVVSQTRTAANRFNDYFTHPRSPSGQTAAYLDVNRLQHWLNTHHLASIKIERQGHKIVNQIRRRDVGKYTHRIVSFVEGAAISIGTTIFELVVLIVVSIYMLLDLQRFGRVLDRRFPPRPGEKSLLLSMESSLVSYVRGQIALSLIIGSSAGVGLWALGAAGALPHGQRYALLFGAWVAVTEVIPYLGPWLGAIPPVIFALVVHPLSAVWVVILFLAIHQLEGHVVVPNVMGSALRLHPLLVIFGLASGLALYGLLGALTALPVLAVIRAIWEFFADRITFERWNKGDPMPTEVELERTLSP